MFVIENTCSHTILPTNKFIQHKRISRLWNLRDVHMGFGIIKCVFYTLFESINREGGINIWKYSNEKNACYKQEKSCKELNIYCK